MADGPADPRSIQREARLLLRCARPDARLVGARGAQHARAERTERRPLDRAGGAHRVDRLVRQLGRVHLQLDDEPRVAITRQHLGEARNPASLAAKPREVVTRVQPRQLIGRSRGNRPGPIRRPLQRRVVVDDDHAVPRQVDVELDAVGAKCKTVIEGENRVLGPERCSAAVREYYRHGRYWFKGFKGFKATLNL